MTAKEDNYEADLSFLDAGAKYYAYVYTDNSDSSNIQMEKKEAAVKNMENGKQQDIPFLKVSDFITESSR